MLTEWCLCLPIFSLGFPAMTVSRVTGPPASDEGIQDQNCREVVVFLTPPKRNYLAPEKTASSKRKRMV